ncbi:hypothetical protein HMPREF9372_0993 [Sporosarcina newyorkensis 2681]|uniref:Uncharacterized protein n=1 Tax=Sporosarcina newyorkensis 2681 TaxID=1027292 RepID=F9DQB3_9BACL|nr:hypothetical protein HMPREF9372_0993 [Sporosarcina newyorkensis 2681]
MQKPFQLLFVGRVFTFSQRGFSATTPAAQATFVKMAVAPWRSA